MMEVLNRAITTALFGFVVSSTMAMGVGLTIGQIVDALRNARLVLLALFANFVLMPLGALALATVLRLDEPLTAAGAPFLPKLTELAKGNLPFAVGTMLLLTLSTVGYLPLVLPLLLSDVSVDSAKIARSLSLLMLFPLAVGLALKALHQDVAARVKTMLDWICGINLVPLVLLVTLVTYQGQVPQASTQFQSRA
jgi:BASS family bile acid:Na+ symporter